MSPDWLRWRRSAIRLVLDFGPKTARLAAGMSTLCHVNARSGTATDSTIGPVARFIAAGIVATTVIAVGAYWVVNRNAVAEAIRNAQEITAIDGRAITAPALTEPVVSGDPQAVAAFDRLIRERVLSSRVVRVKIWSLDGLIVYSDQPALIGQTFPLAGEEQEAIHANRIAAEVSELNRPENRYERGYGRLLEVYLPIHSESGATYLFETYQVYSSIDQDQQRIWSAFFPVLLGGLLLLLAVQVPLAWTLARRLKRAQLEREALLSRSLEVSAAERRRIARDLHDGVVQSLAGAAYSLDAEASGARPDQPELAAAITDIARLLRQSVRDLRTLIVDIAPPDLAGPRLETAISDLLAPLAASGVETNLDVAGLEAVDRETAVAVFRSIQEAVRNTAAHAGATRIDVTVNANADGAALEVRDNGRGFTADDLLARRREGHVGIAMLKTLVEDAGGRLSVSSEPGHGTAIRASFARVRAT